MYPENKTTPRKGWIEVICGSMFSGKTEELIRRIRRARIAQQVVEIYKPSTDTRYAAEKVVSHDANEIHSITVAQSSEILQHLRDADVIAVDEAQFFDDGILEVCNEIANKGRRVIVAGLDKDFRGMPFGPMPRLMAAAEYVTKVHAVCVNCGALANFSHRTSADDGLIVLGEKNNYQPLCRECFNKESR